MDSIPFPDWLALMWREGIDERTRDMVTKRYAGLTLEEIGQDHGVTRERVRQLVATAEKNLAFYADRLQPGWRDEVGELLAKQVVVSNASFTQFFTDADEQAVQVLIGASGAQVPRTWAGRVNGFWSRDADLLSVALRDLTDQAPFAAGELEHLAREAGIADDLAIDDLLAHPRSPLVAGPEGTWLRRRARGRDAVYLWLSARAEPCRIEEITAAVDPGARPASIAEQLRRDERFRQIRPEGTWALTDWPNPETNPFDYANALDAVIDVVTELGPLPRRTMFAEVLRRYPVSEARVQQCLISDRLGTTDEGWYDLVERGATPVEESEPRRPRNIVVNDDGTVVGLRLQVDHEVERGSGVIVHSWLTWFLGLRRAPMSRHFTLGSGEKLTVARNTSAAQLSSLRAHTRALGMVNGCVLAVVFHLDTSRASLRHACVPNDCPAQTGEMTDRALRRRT